MKHLVTAFVCAGLCLPAAGGAQTIAPEAAEQPKPRAAILSPAARTASGEVILPRDTLIRLMVTKEVNSRDSKAGDRFKLRVDEDVVVDGLTLIPVGANATGEIVSVRENGAVGKSGQLAARLLYVEVGDHRIPVSGEQQTKGATSGNRVAMSVLGFGLLGLLTKGNSAKLKAGDILNGYVAEDMLFDPATSAYSSAAAPVSAAQSQ